MKIVHAYPPNWEDIKKAFKPDRNYVFTYGDTLYAPDTNPDDVLISHEEVHARQQSNPEEWWKRYIGDPKFRAEQEIEAYRAQYKFYCNKYKSRELRFSFLKRIATDLSSNNYGSLMSFIEAYGEISRG